MDTPYQLPPDMMWAVAHNSQGGTVAGTKLSSRAKTSTRIRYLDGLRGVAALFVLVHHGWAMVFPPEHGITPTGWLQITYWAKFGPYGVAVFIVLAGYSLTLGVDASRGQLRGSTIGWFKKRARRLLPPYYIALVGTAILSALWLTRKTGTHWDLSVPFDWNGVWTNALLIQDLVPFHVTNVAYTFWSIAVEWHIYFMFPLLLLVWRKRGYRIAAALGIALGLGGSFAAVFYPSLEQLHFDYYALFAVGMLACAVSTDRPLWANRIPWGLVSLGLIALWALFIVVKAGGFLATIADPSLAVGASIAALLIAMSRGGSQRARALLESRAVSGAGVFSYSLYLIHAPLLQAVWLLTVEPLGLAHNSLGALAVMWLLACPLIVLVSWAFYCVAERPFMNHKPVP